MAAVDQASVANVLSMAKDEEEAVSGCGQFKSWGRCLQLAALLWCVGQCVVRQLLYSTCATEGG